MIVADGPNHFLPLSNLVLSFVFVVLLSFYHINNNIVVSQFDEIIHFSAFDYYQSNIVAFTSNRL